MYTIMAEYANENHPINDRFIGFVDTCHEIFPDLMSAQMAADLLNLCNDTRYADNDLAVVFASETEPDAEVTEFFVQKLSV